MRLLFLFLSIHGCSCTGIALAQSAWFPVGKEGATMNYWDKSTCEKVEQTTCYQTANCPLDECSLQEVDDETRPKFKKEQATECQGKEDCYRVINEELECTDQAGAVINEDYTEAYCAVPDGFHKKIDLVIDEAKKNAKEVALQEEQQRQELIANGMRRQEIGRRLIALITANNDTKELTPEQTLQLMGQLQPIIAALQLGAIETAKAQIQQLEPDGVLILQEDIDLGLSQLAKEGY